jgi:hypothetical protein
MRIRADRSFGEFGFKSRPALTVVGDEVDPDNTVLSSSDFGTFSPARQSRSATALEDCRRRAVLHLLSVWADSLPPDEERSQGCDRGSRPPSNEAAKSYAAGWPSLLCSRRWAPKETT